MLFASMVATISWLTWLASWVDLNGVLVGLSALALGAVSITNIRRSADMYVFDIIATADADTVTASIPHGMGSIPDVWGQQLIIQTVVSAALWSLTTLDVTNLVFTKATGVGSGNASAQYRVYVARRR